MREYEVVFNVYGYTQLWYHSVGSVSYSRKIERKDDDGNIVYMLENGHISFTVEANSPEAAYEKAIILWMKTDTGLLTINGWNLRWVCNGENRWTKDDMDEDGNVALAVACEYVRDLSKPKYKGNYRIEVTFSWNEKDDTVYDGFSTKQEAFKEACTLACKEAYTQNEEAAHERTCMVYFDAANGIIRLHYTYDGTFCQYEVIPISEEEKEI